MLNVTLIAVGKLKERYLTDACAEYEKRLGAYCRLRVVEVDEYRLPQNPSEAQIQAIRVNFNSLRDCMQCSGNFFGVIQAFPEFPVKFFDVIITRKREENIKRRARDYTETYDQYNDKAY